MQDNCFHYSESQWDDIRKELLLGRMKSLEKQFNEEITLHGVRHELEFQGNEFIQGAFESMADYFYGYPGEKKDLRKIRVSIKRLQDRLSAYTLPYRRFTKMFFEITEPDELQLLSTLLDKSYCLIESRLNQLDGKMESTHHVPRLNRSPGESYYEVKAARVRQIIPQGSRLSSRLESHYLYFSKILNLWIQSGGQLKTATVNGKPGGPLIRFLQKGLQPVYEHLGLKCPTPDALRDFVRRARARKLMWLCGSVAR